VAAAQREVIDADHVRRRTGRRIGQAEDQPHPGLPASSGATWDSNPGQRPPSTPRLRTHQPEVGLTELAMGGIVRQ